MYKSLITQSKTVPEDLIPSSYTQARQKLLIGLSYGTAWPMAGRLFRQSFIMVCFALARLRKQGEYVKLYQLLALVLTDKTLKTKENYRWWYLMRFGVALAQEQQNGNLFGGIQLQEDLIYLGSMGPKPWIGYDAAYSFLGFSLWFFERGDIVSAIDYAKIAIAADDTWGYPEYLLGWYGLFTKGVDSVFHFTNAVRSDWSF
jgi:hypothetical protein